MSHFQSLSAYRRSQPVRVTPPLHREIHENDLILGAKQFITCRFLSDQGKTAVNTVVFTRILTMSRRKYTAINQLGFNSLHPMPGKARAAGRLRHGPVKSRPMSKPTPTDRTSMRSPSIRRFGIVSFSVTAAIKRPPISR